MIAGVFDEVFGVPTHPLAVHAPIVLVPIASDRGGRARRHGPTGGDAISWLMAGGGLRAWSRCSSSPRSPASRSVEAENVFGDISEHQDLADTTFVLAIVWFVAHARRDDP